MASNTRLPHERRAIFRRLTRAPIGDAEAVLREALAAYGDDEDDEDDGDDEGAGSADDGWRSTWDGLASGGPVGDAVKIAAPDTVQRLLLVPVTRPADVPAHLGWWGAANYDLSGGDISAVLRSWEDRFGAVLIGMGFDTLTLHAAHPPVEPRQIELVAREQFAFCPDIVDQGVETIEALQECVADARWWFWWD